MSVFCQQLFGRSFPAAARVCRFGSKRGCSSSKQEEGFVDEYGDNVDFGPDDRPLYNRVVDNVKMFHRETKEALTKEKFEFEQIGIISVLGILIFFLSRNRSHINAVAQKNKISELICK